MGNTFKPGQRVSVAFEGVVDTPGYDLGHALREGQTLVSADGAMHWLKDERLTLIAEPVKVGDVLTSEDAEPPNGSVVLDGFALQRTAWLRDNDGVWNPTYGDALDPDGWDFVAGSLNGPVTVLYIPESA